MNLRAASWLLGALFLGSMVSACGGGASKRCNGNNPDPFCGVPCSASNPCYPGFRCEADVCTNECTRRSDCEGGEVCTSDGRCVPEGENAGPCDREPPHEDCGIACNPTIGCDTFFFCEGGVCGSECDETTGCVAGQVCGLNGRCTDAPPRPDRPDIGVDLVCSSVNVSGDAITPTVILVIDWSGSMNASFGSSDRWLSVYDVLVDPQDGVVSNLQDRVIFGATLYSSSNGGNNTDPGDAPCALDDPATGNQFPAYPPTGTPSCLCVRQVAPALNSANAIRNAIPLPGGGEDTTDVILEDTPTGDTIRGLTDQYVSLDSAENPVIFIVATDGEPDTCANGDPSGATQQAAANTYTVDQAERAHQMGIDTYVVSVGSGTVSTDHLQEMSNVGLGLPRNGSGGDATVFVGNNPAALQAQIESIIQGQLSCDLDLSRTLTSVNAVCNGTVRLGTQALQCRGTDCSASSGFCAVDTDTIRLLGTDCDTFRTTNGLALTGVFPCDAIVVE